MQLLGMLEALLDVRLFILDAQLVERVVNRMLELIETVRLAEDIVGAEPHRLGNLVDRGLAAENDDGGVDFLLLDEAQNLVARLTRHIQVENDQVELALPDQRDRLFAVGRLGDIGPVTPQQLDQALPCGYIIVDHQESDALVRLWRMVVFTDHRIFHEQKTPVTV